ncbi:MAG: hypothetical protein PHZ24_10700 [Bacteroidales bacterium]|nr:hypothetical protein [Bacteroidales bacterium]
METWLRVKSGELGVGSGELGVGSGEWGVGSGEWGVGSGESCRAFRIERIKQLSYSLYRKKHT